jgi:hypothetical protein
MNARGAGMRDRGRPLDEPGRAVGGTHNHASRHAPVEMRVRMRRFPACAARDPVATRLARGVCRPFVSGVALVGSPSVRASHSCDAGVPARVVDGASLLPTARRCRSASDPAPRRAYGARSASGGVVLHGGTRAYERDRDEPCLAAFCAASSGAGDRGARPVSPAMHKDGDARTSGPASVGVPPGGRLRRTLVPPRPFRGGTNRMRTGTVAPGRRTRT